MAWGKGARPPQARQRRSAPPAAPRPSGPATTGSGGREKEPERLEPSRYTGPFQPNVLENSAALPATVAGASAVSPRNGQGVVDPSCTVLEALWAPPAGHLARACKELKRELRPTVQKMSNC